MTRLVLFLLGVVALAAGLSWLAEQPGTISIAWPGYDIETSLFRAAVVAAFLIGLCVFLFSIFRQIWSSPATVGRFINRRRQERGLEALSSGMIAIGAGDRALATRYAVQARKALPNEPLTHLLRAQAAQLSGDRTTSRRIFEAMLGTPDTEQLGLRGLFLEAEREGEREAALQFATRAMALNPKLSWSVDALFDLQCKTSDWAGALDTLAVAKKNGHIEKVDADRRRAVLLTAQAQALEDDNAQKALDLALEAHNLAPDLIPAATIAGRQLASRGSTPKAARVIERAWKRSPHPDLATVYAFARPGDSPRDRLERIKRLARTTPHSSEGPIAIATSAIEARNWDEAKSALAPLLDHRLSHRVCTLMARIEGAERNNQGGVREWLARAVNAPRDPAWTADGVVSETWKPISPVTGALDAFQWKVPLESAHTVDADQALEKMEEYVMLGNEADDDSPVIESDVAPIEPEPSLQPTPSRSSELAPNRKQDRVPPAAAVVATVPPPPQAPQATRSEISTPSQIAARASTVVPVVRPAPGTISKSPAADSESSISVEIVAPAPAPKTQLSAVPQVSQPAKEKITVAKPVEPHRAQQPPVSSPQVAKLIGSVSAGALEASSHGHGHGSERVPHIEPGRSNQNRQDGRKPVEQQLFVPPRAPDDPGTEDEIISPRDYRPKPAKR